MDNKQRIMIFGAVFFLVLILTISIGVSQANGAAIKALDLQEKQLTLAKQCATECDSKISSGEISCDWIECSERCQIGDTC
ncbi:MAG: hypothetical protein ABH986_04090 [archaeon]